jgi:hypothetical protein
MVSSVHSATNLTIAAARDLLDWLEGRGIKSREVVLEANGTMSVRWVGEESWGVSAKDDSESRGLVNATGSKPRSVTS